MPEQVARLAVFFGEAGIDVVNTHSSRDAWMAGLAARMARVPLIIRSRHIDVDYGVRFFAQLGFAWIPHHVLTTSDQITKKLAEEAGLEKDRITCVPTGIDLDQFSPGTGGKMRAELGIDLETPLVGMISVLRSWKGHDHFLQAAARLKKRRPAVKFVIAGEGPSRSAIEEKIRALGLQGEVLMLGHREDVQEILRALGVLVLPSTAHEGVPQIILQAQAVGCPVVGTRVGGIPEVVEDGETGWLVPPGDSDSLAHAIEDAIGDRIEAERRVSQARQRVLRCASLDAMGERLLELYRHYLSNLAEPLFPLWQDASRYKRGNAFIRHSIPPRDS
jgi:glycosyltransferase involved in cell wall biosynthesis